MLNSATRDHPVDYIICLHLIFDSFSFFYGIITLLEFYFMEQTPFFMPVFLDVRPSVTAPSCVHFRAFEVVPTYEFTYKVPTTN